MTALPLANGVRVLTATSGTGAYSLGATVTGYLSPFTELSSGARSTWRIESADGTLWELIEGTLTSGSPSTLSRDRIVRTSSGGTTAINWPDTSAKRISLVMVADRTPYLDSSGVLLLQADPSTPMGAATKQYTDNAVAQTLELGRHRIQNGLFRINQRGTASVTTGGLYPVDRWLHSDNAAGSRTVSQVTLTDADRTAIGDQDATSGVQIVTAGSAGTSDFELFYQNIEGVRTYAGKTVTLSFWAIATAASKSISLELVQNFGTGGSPSASVGTFGAKFNLTTSWARYSVTVAVPSLTGKALGTNGNDMLQLFFWTSGGSSFNSRTGTLGQQSSTITLWGVQDDLGSITGMIDKPNLRHELADCQRFFQTYTGLTMVAYQAATAAMGQTFFLPVQMRATPTAILSGQSYFNCASLTALPNTTSVFISATTTALGAAQWGTSMTLSADL